MNNNNNISIKRQRSYDDFNNELKNKIKKKLDMSNKNYTTEYMTNNLDKSYNIKMSQNNFSPPFVYRQNATLSVNIN